MFVINKLIKTFLTSNHCFQLKYESYINNIAFSSERKSHLIWIRREIHTDQALFTNQNSSKQECWWILMWEDNKSWMFLLHKKVVWITCGLLCLFFSAIWSLILTAPIRIHWWASDVMLHFSKSVPMKKQTHLPYMLNRLRVHFQQFSFLGKLFL